MKGTPCVTGDTGQELMISNAVGATVMLHDFWTVCWPSLTCRLNT